MAEHPLKTKLQATTDVLRELRQPQLARLLEFVNFPHTDFDVSFLGTLLRKVNAGQLDQILYITQGGGVSSTTVDAAPDELVSGLSEHQLQCFSALFTLFQLQHLLIDALTADQVMRFAEFIPGDALPDHQLQMLKMLQELLRSIDSGSLLQLQRDMLAYTQHDNFSLFGASSAASHQDDLLRQVLEIPVEKFVIISQSLRKLLNLPSDELQIMHAVIPQLQYMQLMLIVRLLQIDPFYILEFQQTLSPVVLAPHGPVEDPMEEETTLVVQCVDQPPERSVYRRNLKPNPSVTVSGDIRSLQPGETLVVVPTLVRCDTQKVMKPSDMTGTTPVVVTSNSLIKFSKLKIQTTSHQQDETMFAVRFELRKCRSETDYDVVSFVQTTPINVVSHSTQLSKPSTTSPVIQEVCPPAGPTSGGTRVAIIGQNFVDNPKAMVRFDTTPIKPQFFGPGTLVCTTPQHVAGVVSVSISNDSVRWSDTGTTFTFAVQSQLVV